MYNNQVKIKQRLRQHLNDAFTGFRFKENPNNLRGFFFPSETLKAKTCLLQVRLEKTSQYLKTGFNVTQHLILHRLSDRWENIHLNKKLQLLYQR